MAFFARLAVAFAGGLAVLAMLLMLAAYLLSGEPAVSRAPPPDRAELFATTLERRNAARSDFEVVGGGVIVPTSAAAEVLNQCSRETVTPIEGYWRPTPTMVRELEARLPTFLSYESRLEPLTSYIRQYAGVVSMGRPLIYASFLTAPDDLPWQREVLIVCDGGNRAWGVTFDVQSKTFGEVRINGSRTAATDAWLGRWNGPEGTFLLLEKADGEGYSVTVQNLDGPRVFRGTAGGDRIEFDRDGVTESMRPTDGAATGMKWLADKGDCLTIRYGEGYCRD